MTTRGGKFTQGSFTNSFYSEEEGEVNELYCIVYISLFQWIGNFTKQILDILLNKTASREEERLKKAQNL